MAALLASVGKEGASAGVGLVGRGGALERRQLVAGRFGGEQARPAKVRAETAGIAHLRDEADVGERHAIAEAKRAVLRLDQALAGVEAIFDGLAGPLGRRLLAARERLDPLQDLEVLDRMGVAGDDLRERADLRPAHRVLRQQGRLGVNLFQVIADGQRLREHPPVIEFQRGNEALRVEPQECLGTLFALAQDVGGIGVFDPLQFQRNADAVRGTRAEESVQSHV